MDGEIIPLEYDQIIWIEVPEPGKFKPDNDFQNHHEGAYSVRARIKAYTFDGSSRTFDCDMQAQIVSYVNDFGSQSMFYMGKFPYKNLPVLKRLDVK
jgi:hypothetical protein